MNFADRYKPRREGARRLRRNAEGVCDRFLDKAAGIIGIHSRPPVRNRRPLMQVLPGAEKVLGAPVAFRLLVHAIGATDLSGRIPSWGGGPLINSRG